VVLASGGDASMLAHVVGLLLRNGIEVTRLKQAATSSVAHAYWGGPVARQTFPAGSYVVDLGQPQRRLAKALLEPGAAFDRGFVEQQIQKFQRNRRRGESADREDYDFYDITAWSLPSRSTFKPTGTKQPRPPPATGSPAPAPP